MSKVRKNFNNASANYDDHAFLQKEIANRLSEKLNVISIDPKIVIDLGSLQLKRQITRYLAL